jgi:predicted DsbA family dithiol-disulfide isomerase
MALPPKFAGTALRVAPPAPTDSSVPSTTHTLEFYLDYVCPFSAKQFNTILNSIKPLVEENPRWASNLTIIFRQQVQPWHPSSTLVHEAGLAVLQLAPAKFWDFSRALFDDQKSYFDVNVVNETRNATYRRLADLAGTVGLNKNEVYNLLAIPEKAGDDGALNAGNGVTADLKLITKMNRLIGVHVSPTAVFDGVVYDTSSSWGKDEWKEWLTKNLG